MTDDDRPVIIGTATVTLRDMHEVASSPQDMMADAARLALADAGGRIDPRAIDTIAAIRTFADSAPQFASPLGGAKNYPLAVARRIGATPAHAHYPHVGGNSPQMMVNMLADEIAHGRSRLALVVGGEAIRSMQMLARSDERPDWTEDDPLPLSMPGDARLGMTAHEMRHGIANPSDVYPLFESALAAHYGRSMDEQRDHIARMLARLSGIAAANPHAAIPLAREAAGIREASPENRMIAWPYTKFMNANMFVDQAAAVLIASKAAARDMGVAPDAMIYLTGSADLNDRWHVSERSCYHASPAIRAGAGAALAQAGIGVDDLDLIDLYSCFPCAVEIAADALGIAHDDPRGLSITGGLPFFGGAGNAYSLLAIAEMVQRLKSAGRGQGLVTANGWYLTKHSFGVYSTEPPSVPWYRRNDTPLQAGIDAMPAPLIDEAPEGEGEVEASTVTFSRAGPERAIIIGRLRSGARFLANGAPGDSGLHEALMGPHPVGLSISVHSEKGRSLARLA